MRKVFMILLCSFALFTFAGCRTEVVVERVVVVTATPEPTPTDVPATATPTQTATLVPTITPTPTNTVVPTATVEPTATLSPTPTVAPLAWPERGEYPQTRYLVKETTDRFTGLHSITVSRDYDQHGLPPDGTLMLYMEYVYSENDFPGEVKVAFLVINRTWEYLRCHGVDALVDGQPLSLKSEHDGIVGRGYVVETVLSAVPLDDFLRMVNADEVEFRVCRTEFKFGEAMQAMKDFASRLPDEVKQRTYFGDDGSGISL